MEREKIIVFDTTLRDGEQASGFHMYPDEKFAIAQALDGMGVDVIEAGNPVSSPGDYKAVLRIAEEIDGPVIAGLARCVEADIVAAGEAIAPAAKRGRGRIHVYIGTSTIHAEKKLRKSTREILDMAVWAVGRARDFTDDVEFSCEDFGRSDPDYTANVIAETIKAGARTINLPDTVGYRLPEEIDLMVRNTIAKVSQKINVPHITYSVHCHNDLGLATANTIAAILGGVGQIEVTINGIGERAGNAALEEVVAALRERPEFFERELGLSLYTDIDTKKIYAVSQMVSKFTGKRPQRNKAIVGENAFSHEAGVHMDGVVKDPRTYEFINPSDYGCESRLTFGARSGRRGLREAYRRLNLEFSDDEFSPISERFKGIADNVKTIDDCHLAMAMADVGEVPVTYELVSVETYAKDSGGEAIVHLSVGGNDMVAKRYGDGMIDAAVKAVNEITSLNMNIIEYRSESATPGSEAIGKETIVTKNNGIRVIGYGTDTDTVRGAVKAYVDAVNRMRFVLDTVETRRQYKT